LVGHGPGGAPGSAVSHATKQPVDLRTYVQSHGGKFPAADWLAVIADIRPASVHAKVWKTIKQAQAGSTVQNEPAARGVVGSIALYRGSFVLQSGDRPVVLSFQAVQMAPSTPNNTLPPRWTWATASRKAVSG
jgi:hypothetical protein